MPRRIEYIGEIVEVADYESGHRYCNQKDFIEGIPVDPTLRSGFDSTPNEDREKLEISDWWNKPYIQTCSWDDMSESWSEYSERMSYCFKDREQESEEQFHAQQKKQKESWFKAWSSGIRYEVRCLNGGAWDRSTSLGMTPSLKDAVAIATEYSPIDYGEILRNIGK